MGDRKDDVKQGLERRVLFLRIFLVAVFLLYGARLFSMQILSGDSYSARAQDISRRTSTIKAQRGEIFDRSFSSPLAMNIETFNVSIVPAEVPAGKMQQLVQDLSAIIGIPPADITAKIPEGYARLFYPVEIAGNVSFEVISALAERRVSLPGVTWNNGSVRRYSDMGSISHLVGYVGEINRDDLVSLHNEGYQQGDIIGRTGIERQYEPLLRGKHGTETRVVDARGLRVADLGSREAPETGSNLVLTIDRRIQTLAEEALGQRAGSVVVLRPGTGEVLAMVSYPWFDPNVFVNGDSAAFRVLQNNPQNPLLNRAIQSSFAPASTFKVIMTTAVLAENAFPANQTVTCTGSVQFGGRTWRCWHAAGHGRLSLAGGLANSCNVYFWTVGRDHLGIDNIVNYSREMGLGSVSGIDLPGESPGDLPTPEWKQRRFRESWFDGDTMNMSIGQGWTLATPLQMANVLAMVVNGGTVYVPHLLKEVRDPVTGEIVETVEPKVLHKMDVDPQIFELVRSALRTTITTGTARFMNAIAVPIGGKTGTAEVGANDRWHSWFVAFGPYGSENKDEQIAMAMIVEATNDWEWWGTWATAAIMQGIFANLTYEQAVRSLGLQGIMLH